MNPVKESCAFICQHAEHVKINDEAIKKIVDDLTDDRLLQLVSPKAFDATIHFVDGTDLTVQYILVVDTLNFCFWPETGLDYDHLSRGVKAALEKDPHALDADRLANISEAEVREFFLWPANRPVPQMKERVRLLRETGNSLIQHFHGRAAEMVESAKGSALALVDLVTAFFPGFRDHAIYKGHQVFIYKRAQIFVADVYGAFQGQGLYGKFHDIDQLTMFADYRVPAQLHGMGVLSYSAILSEKIRNFESIPAGSEWEIELRAATVEAVERIRDRLISKHHSTTGMDEKENNCTTGSKKLIPNAVQLDWWLWEAGEATLKLPGAMPEHRTLTIYY
mmetsp:Transcript_19534/g.35217  ORF Transcript_19534/g.35217 Transcript_19534/m.35217 type:complete len:336 (-) Transcript_19534:155-1162(-)